MYITGFTSRICVILFVFDIDICEFSGICQVRLGD